MTERFVVVVSRLYSVGVDSVCDVVVLGPFRSRDGSLVAPDEEPSDG